MGREDIVIGDMLVDLQTRGSLVAPLIEILDLLPPGRCHRALDILFRAHRTLVTPEQTARMVELFAGGGNRSA